MVATSDHLKTPQSPKELQRAEVTTFQKVLNHANYKGKPWMPYQLPIEGIRGGVETHYPPLFNKDPSGENFAFSISHKKYPEDILGHANAKTGFSVTVWKENSDETIPPGVAAWNPPKYIVHNEFAPGAPDATQERAKFLELMNGALVHDASVAEISLPKDMKDVLSGAQMSLGLIVRKETDKFPLGYVEKLSKLTDLDLSKHDLQAALYQDNINSGSKGEYKGFTLKPLVERLSYTMQLANFTQCPKGEPIKPGLKLIVRNKPDLLTTKDVPLVDDGTVLNCGNINHAPEITEIIDIGAILEGKADDSSYVVLRDNKQVTNPYPFTQPAHVEKSQNFQLLRLHECLAGYRA